MRHQLHIAASESRIPPTLSSGWRITLRLESMSFGPDDSGILEFKTEEEAEEYLGNLGSKFEYGCHREGNPIQCHSLARWYASYKRDFAKSEDVYRQNCFHRRYAESCSNYAFYKLFGATAIKRNASQAFEALKFGCHVCEHPKCCQGAGELLLEGAIDAKQAASESTMDYFTRGCRLNLPASCFYLGGLYHHRAEAQRVAEVELTGVAQRRTLSELEAELRRSAAAAWVRACELNGHELACRNAARAYRIGDGVERDEAKAAAFEARINQVPPEKT
ncbi:Cytochrome c oxidase assembly factor 7B [Echinococcus granulosus]|uniref:Hcp beta-lactamase-like protein n=1 Tax=Echinococcus granulosus TaxID=6210 RepID=U6J0L6_ECHGR|nr:Hcp beta-lactamase-like protein [Echinococcus granulosus]EUB55975.1 Hcp beta-lactamase-like protein [Echinococcus granulosus]KAH9283981.1 Cytochrome c oxidase assembly factor 7B [Echinococcus granulosus]CDS16787.1 sel1 repeat containing protein 1 [Echinococcus granulosus]CDS16805.1 sel1 repeat containing protein 1B [Echinococcus granulosus]